MTLFVIRHCSTVCSEKKIFCGRTDLPLSPLGEREKEALAQKTWKFDAVLSSPLLRARQTAEAVARGPVLYDGRLRERDFGDFEGTSCARPDGAPYRHSMDLKYPNGESYLDVFARIRPLLKEIGRRYAGKRVCLVSHGSVCRVIRACLTKMTEEQFYGWSQPNGTAAEYDM